MGDFYVNPLYERRVPATGSDKQDAITWVYSPPKPEENNKGKWVKKRDKRAHHTGSSTHTALISAALTIILFTVLDKFNKAQIEPWFGLAIVIINASTARSIACNGINLNKKNVLRITAVLVAAMLTMYASVDDNDDICENGSCTTRADMAWLAVIGALCMAFPIYVTKGISHHKRHLMAWLAMALLSVGSAYGFNTLVDKLHANGYLDAGLSKQDMILGMPKAVYTRYLPIVVWWSSISEPSKFMY